MDLDESSPSSSTLTTCSSTSSLRQVASGGVLPLKLLYPVPEAQRLNRSFRGADGQLHIRQVIQRVDGEIPVYVIERTLTKATSRGCILLLATPAKPENNLHPNSAYTPVVACGEPVAIKAMPHPEDSKSSSSHDPYREIAAMQLLQQHSPHPNVNRLLDCLQDSHYVYLVQPYLSRGDLLSKVQSTGGAGLQEEEVRVYFRAMVEGLLFLKEAGSLAHHDVSLENVMFSSRGTIKLIDFGTAMRVAMVGSEGSIGSHGRGGDRARVCPRRYCGKPNFIAPELARRKPSCDMFAADVWSLGVCLYVMLTGQDLYDSPDDETFDCLCQGGIRNVLDAEDAPLGPAAIDLLYHLLEAEPEGRLTLEEVIRHPFLRRRLPAKKQQRGGKPKVGKMSKDSPTAPPPSGCLPNLFRLFFTKDKKTSSSLDQQADKFKGVRAPAVVVSSSTPVLASAPSFSQSTTTTTTSSPQRSISSNSGRTPKSGMKHSGSRVSFQEVTVASRP